MQNHNTPTKLLSLAAFLLCLNVLVLAIPQSGGNPEPVATVKADASKMTWEPKISFEALTLTVATPDGEVVRQEVHSGAIPSFNVTDDQGQKRPDGQYRYELRVTPIISIGVREALKAARQNETEEQTLRTLRAQGALPAESLVQSGAFRILNGAIIFGAAAEPQNINNGSEIPRRIASRNDKAAPADQVIADDLIVQGSICAGLDCINNENFGADTIRLKENNLRIHFDDTSSTGSFPSNDWRLVANDQSNGGLSQFSIEDVTNGKVPFLVEANSPTSSIYVDSTGRVGFRTSTPVLDMHTNTSNTPALRLEQNNSGGFTAQTWDVAGNETVFFIRDATNGSLLPFKIQPGAATNSLFISSAGKIGLGTTTPEQKLHVAGNVVIDGSLEVRDGSFFTAMQSLYQRLLQRESEMNALQQKNDELQNRLTEFERRIQALEAKAGGRR